MADVKENNVLGGETNSQLLDLLVKCLEVPNAKNDEAICTIAELITQRGDLFRRRRTTNTALPEPTTGGQVKGIKGGKPKWALGPPKPGDMFRVNIGGTWLNLDSRLLDHEPDNLISVNLRQAKNFAKPESLEIDVKATGSIEVGGKSDDRHEEGELRYERDPENFRLIWSYLQGCRSMLPSMPKWRLHMLRFDADYFGFHTMVQDIDWALYDQPSQVPEEFSMYLNLAAGALENIFRNRSTTSEALWYNIAHQYVALEENQQKELIQSLANTRFGKFLTRPQKMPSQSSSVEPNPNEPLIRFVRNAIAQTLAGTVGNVLENNIPVPNTRRSLCVRVTMKAMAILKAGVGRTKSLFDGLKLIWMLA